MVNKSKIEKIIDIYLDAKAKISDILDNDPNLLLRNMTVLDRLINSLRHSIGISIAPVNEVQKPLEYIFGRKLDLVGGAQQQILVEELSPKDQEMENLKRDVSVLYNTIDNRDNSEILESNSELEIRALAKSMGIEYSNDDVPNLNSNFINTLRLAVKARKEQEAQRDLVINDAKVKLRISEVEKLGLTVTDNDPNLMIISKGDKKLAELSKDEFINTSNDDFNLMIQKLEGGVNINIFEESIGEVSSAKNKRRSNKANNDK